MRMFKRVMAAVSAGAAVVAGAATLAPAGGGGGIGANGELACMHCRLEAMRQAPAAGAERGRGAEMDEATGRSLLNYPPDPVVEFRSMTLEVFIADMNVPRLEATAAYTLAPIGKDVESLTLDAGPRESMQFGAAMMSGGGSVALERGDRTITLRFSPAVPAGQQVDVRLPYTLVNPAEGLTWTTESAAWPGRAAQLHSQGQPESNHYWFPCHDFPNVRMPTRIIATVPKGYVVCSNGKLAASGADRGRPGYETFDWVQSKPHVPYLVTLVVGKFDVVDVGGGGWGDRKLPMPVYAPQGKGDLVRQTYGRTAEMVRLFEEKTGQAYPWDKYAQVIVHNFGAGGMENTSATTMFDTAVLDKAALLDGDLDGLISHELAHQWYGDLLTCKSWEHIWLNEGFATYFTTLWFEKRDGGKSRSPVNDAYQAGVWDHFQGPIDNDRADAPFQPAMASRVWGHPWETFRRAANPYPKGASILHMLRMRLGDEAFFRALGVYTSRHAGKAVESSDFRRALEEVSGLSLQRFFAQWVERPGVPRIRVTPTFDASTGQLTIALEQTQNIDGFNPAFDVEVPMWISTGNGGGSRPTIRFDNRTASISMSVDGPPEFVAVDPDLTVLAAFEVAQTPAQWLAQVANGPTYASRLQALKALRGLAPESVDAAALRPVEDLASNGRAHHQLRSAAVATLGHFQARGRLLGMADRNWPDDARVRRTVVEQIAGLAAKTGADTQLTQLLMDRAQRDPSYGVRSAAVLGLGNANAAGAMTAALAALEIESQHDQVRQAALEALGKLDEAEGLEPAIRYTRFGIMPRTRPTAVQTVATLAHHDRERAISVLTGLLEDSEQRTVRSAADGLVQIGDARSIGVLEERLAKTTSDVARADFARNLADLRAKVAAAAAATPAAPANPAPAAADGIVQVHVWRPIARIEDWFLPEDRDKVYNQTGEFFAMRGMVIEMHGGQFYLLCWSTPENVILGGSGWTLEQTAINKDQAGRPMIELSLDRAGADLLGRFTEANLGRFMALLVDEQVIRAPKIMSRIDSRALITGIPSDDAAAAMAVKVAKPGALSFRLTVLPSELGEGEKDIRERFRANGP